MTAVVLAGGAGAHDPAWFCIDAAGMGSTTDYVPVWERGFRGMSGYITHNYDIPQRCIDAWWELPETWWMLNVEGDPYAGLGGPSVGETYARNGIARARDKGHQGETALIFSLVDFGPTATQFPTLDSTHRAVVDVCAAEGVPVGFYGPPIYLRHLAVLEWVPADCVYWQWGGGGAPEWWTTVKQAGPSSTPGLVHDLSGFGFGADENLLWSPMKGWTGYGANPPPTPTGDDDMRHFVTTSEPFPAFVNDWGEYYAGPNPDASFPARSVVFEMVPGGKQHVSAGEWQALTTGEADSKPNPKVGWLEEWTTGRVQTMPNVRHPGASGGAATLKGLDIPSVPGRATPIY